MAQLFLLEWAPEMHACEGAPSSAGSPQTYQILPSKQKSVWDSLQAYFVALGVACAMALLLLAPMANLKSYTQRESARRKRLNLKAA